jgi:hypothetical protein
MEQNLENNDWKTEAPLLAGLPVHNPFSVPEGYFDGLGGQISNAVYLEGLKTAVTESGFTVPEDYMEGLTDHITAAIAVDRLKETVFNEAKVANEGFAVPANYFEQLQAGILAKTAAESAQKPQAKIVRLWHSKLLKYASAACFVIVASFGVLYFNQQDVIKPVTNTADAATEQMLLDIDEQLIIEHIEADSKQTKTTSAVKDAALENYILSNFSQSDLVADL